MSFIPIVNHEDYEIFTEYPFMIRKISNGKIIKVGINDKGYSVVNLNRKAFKLHRLIAMMFIPNPDNLEEVDHIDGNRANYHLENLRWVDHKMNMKNLHSSKKVPFTLIPYDEAPDDLIAITEYNEHVFEDYYYSPEYNSFYLDSGVEYRQLNVLYMRNWAFVVAHDIDGNRVFIYYNKFKKMIGI